MGLFRLQPLLQLRQPGCEAVTVELQKGEALCRSIWAASSSSGDPRSSVPRCARSYSGSGRASIRTFRADRCLLPVPRGGGIVRRVVRLRRHVSSRSRPTAGGATVGGGCSSWTRSRWCRRSWSVVGGCRCGGCRAPGPRRCATHLRRCWGRAAFAVPARPLGARSCHLA